MHRRNRPYESDQAKHPAFRLFYLCGLEPAGRNEARLAEEVEADLRKIIDLGFLRSLRDRPHTYEVRRVIRAFVDAQWLADFDQRLGQYLQTAEEGVR